MHDTITDIFRMATQLKFDFNRGMGNGLLKTRLRKLRDRIDLALKVIDESE